MAGNIRERIPRKVLYVGRLAAPRERGERKNIQLLSFEIHPGQVHLRGPFAFNFVSYGLVENNVPLFPCGPNFFHGPNVPRGGFDVLEFLNNRKLVYDRLIRDRAVSCALSETSGESHGKTLEERDIVLGIQAGRAAYGFETPPIVP